MQITKISWNLAVYLMLIEGISLFLLDLNINSFLIGFTAAFVVLLIYKLSQRFFPLKIDSKPVKDVPFLELSLLNGLFLLALFYLQDLILKVIPHMFAGVFGFLSVFITFFVLILIFNAIPYKISFKLGKENIKVNQISTLFAFYAGLFEFFIMPMIYYGYYVGLNGIYVGLISGLVGGLIGVLITNMLMKRYPLLIE